MLLAVLAGALLAWFAYRGRLHEPLARLAAFARLLGLTALLLLLLDPGFIGRAGQGRPLVLIDRSLSMSGTGGRGQEAIALGPTLGDTLSFGELSAGIPGGSSRLGDLLASSGASGRPVIVITDGEIADSAAIPADLWSRVTVRALPRPRTPDIAITDVRSPEHLQAGDTLTVSGELLRTADAPDSAVIEIRDGEIRILQHTVRFHGEQRAHFEFHERLPPGVKGERWLVVARIGDSDGEPADDLRWLHLVVTATPGIIFLGVTPDWDGRAFYRALKETAATPVSGFTQLQPGRWYRMSDLRAVSAREVTEAARNADLVAVRGEAGPWRTSGHSRLLWSPSDDAGDWFVTGSHISPLASAFQGVDADSLPPALSAHRVEVPAGTGWVGMTARRSRRGVEVPVIAGREGAEGRTVWFGLDGLYRWGARDGVSGQAWRGIVAGATTWLLAGRTGDSLLARPVHSVTQRGRVVRFHWLGAGAPEALEIHLTGGREEMTDSLRFDGTGEAQLALESGHYRYQLGRGGSGAFAVEPYADEIVPGPLTLHSRDAGTLPEAPRHSWRELWWIFALAVFAFGAEWALRRQMGAV